MYFMLFFFCKGEGMRCSPKAHPQNSQSYTNYSLLQLFQRVGRTAFFEKSFWKELFNSFPFFSWPYLSYHWLYRCIGCIKNRRMYIVSVVYSIKDLTRWDRHPKFMSSCLLLLSVQITSNLKMNAFNKIETRVNYAKYHYVTFISLLSQHRFYRIEIIGISFLTVHGLR